VITSLGGGIARAGSNYALAIFVIQLEISSRVHSQQAVELLAAGRAEPSGAS
jgi:hypothetical protein